MYPRALAPSPVLRSQTIGAYWAAFARSGSPNDGCSGGACPEWPQAAPRGMRAAQLQPGGVALALPLPSSRDVPLAFKTQVLVAGPEDARGAAIPHPVADLHEEDCRFWARLFNHSHW